jgi:hypothetical protein
VAKAGPHRHQFESCGRFSGRSEFRLINSERRPAETPKVVCKVGTVVNDLLKFAHDLFAAKVGWRANNFSASESTGLR